MSGDVTIDGLRILPTRHTVADVLRRIQSLAKARGLTVFAQIDFSGDAERAGLALNPTGLVIFGSPKAGTPLMVSAPTVAIDLPLKILTWHDSDGQTWLAYNTPEYLQTRHGFPPEFIKNVAGVGALAEAAAAQDP
jgi:uncharacterized protein (DUF302 family)